MRKLAKKHTYEYLKATYFVRFFGDSFFYTFLYVFLSSKGFSTGQVGLISALAPFAALIGSIIFKKIAKNLDVNRILMVIFGFLEMSVALLFALFPGGNYMFYVIIITITSLLNGPYYSLIDGYSGTYISQRNKQYSSMRIMGTISYVIGPLLGGLLIQHSSAGYTAIFYSCALFLGLATIMTMFLPKQDVEINNDLPLEEKTRINIRKYPDLLPYLIFNFFVISLSTVGDNFFSIYLSDTLGVSTSHYGYLISATIFVEALVFVYIIFKKNMFKSQIVAYLIMGLMVISRPLTIALNMPLPLLYVVATLRGVAWAYYLVYNVKFITKIIPLKHLTNALFLVSIATTVGRIIFSLSAGELLNHLSYPTVFKIICLLIIIGTTLPMYMSYRNKKRAAINATLVNTSK